MVMALALLFGLQAYNSMRVELNPDVSFGVATVTTIYPGAGPEEVNTLVSRKIEEAVSGIENLREVTATSQEGVSVAVLQFEIGTDMNVALNDVRAKVDTVVGELPREAERPVIDKIDAQSDPVLILAMKSDKLDGRQLRDLADNTLKDVFARVTGVANVSVSGGDVREIQVQLSRDALLRYGIGILDVQRAVNQASLNVPSGRIVTGREELTVRVLGEFRTVEEVKNSFLTISDPDQRGPSRKVRLGDVATITDSNAERRSYAKLDGNESVVMVVQKTKVGNAIEVSKAITKTKGPDGKTLVEQLEDQYGVQFTVTLDTSKQIEESIHDLQFSLFFGIILVAGVIWLFLHNLRGMLIVAISIPVCLAATLVALWAFGFTINNLSMLALSLAIGVLVDDSIVVLENIYRHLRMGEPPVEAALNGRAEIGLAAVAITLADVVVFVPIGFMGGVVGQFFKPLGLGYAICVMLSLLVSFTITPMLAARWYRQGEDWEHPKGKFASWFEGSFNRFTRAYQRILTFTLQHRWYAFGAGFAVLVALFMFIAGSFQKDIAAAATGGGAMGMAMISVVIGGLILLGNLISGLVKKSRGEAVKIGTTAFRLALSTMLFAALFPIASVAGKAYQQWKGAAIFNFQFVPPSDGGRVVAAIELPSGSNLEATSAVVKQMEQIIAKHPDVKYVVSQIGRRSGGFGASFTGPQYADITATLYEKASIIDNLSFWVKHEEKLRTRKDTAVVADLIQEVGRVPGAKVVIAAGGGFGFGSAIQLAFTSEDREKLFETASKVRERLAAGAIDGVIQPELTSRGGKPEIRAIPDRARLADANVSILELGGAMRVFYEGDNTTKFRVRGNEYDVRVMMDLEDRNDPTIIGNIPVTFRQGKPIYLSEVAQLTPGQGLDNIERRDRREVVQLNAELLPGFAAGTVQAEIDSLLAAEKLVPEGVSYRALGQADAQARETGFLFGALGLGLVLVYMILASLYNNLLYPLIIQLSQPQAMIGALLALILTDKTLNIVGFIGIIALVGLVGKNAILLVDYTNTLRERGRNRFDALVESGGTRLRPIMMTTLALIFGTLPVALAIGRGSEFRETIGITIIGGTILSTVLTLLIIPCSYTVFDDFSDWLAGIMNRIRDRSTKKAESA